MNWSTLAAWASVAVGVAGLWFVWQQHKRESANAKPTLRIPSTPNPPPPAFPTTYATPSRGQLESEVGADYGKLQQLLAAQQFKAADQETTRLMLWVMSREKEGWLRVEDVEQFPCRDLRTIDQLWRQHSNGRFGFSVQKRIYNEVGENYGALADRVGWRVNGDWVKYKDYKFELRAPVGHLPLGGRGGAWVRWMGKSGFVEVSLLSRRDL